MTTAKPRVRVRAPELVGRGWLNTGGRPLHLADLRGKVLLLDFWTFCCINCLHVLDELRPLEEEFADVLVTVGVHSPKFAHEADPRALADAVARYDVRHPVLDDPSLSTWQAYTVKAWPTLVLVDPQGYIVHVAAGEGHVDALRRVITGVVAEHEAAGTLHRGDGPYQQPSTVDGLLSFPAKATPSTQDTLLVADTAHHRLVELAADGQTVLRVFGTGARGRADGLAATFAEPSGIAVLPTEIAERVGYHVVVADTVNHLLRGIDMATGEVSTVAGTGRQWRAGTDDGPALEVDLTSPWDLAWYPPAGGVVVAMAGNHTLGLFDPVSATMSRFAGTTVEGLADGPVREAFFAQPSGLAVDGDRLWLVDAETSALRWIDGTAPDFQVHTAVGVGLFDFGHRDGDAATALLQHPLGVAAVEGAVLVADTYNGAIRRYDTQTGQVSTLATGLAEPSDVLAVDGELLVVESAAHRVGRLVPGQHLVDGDAHRVTRPPTAIAPGEIELAVVFTPAPGQKLDESFGPPTRLELTSSPPQLLADGAGEGTDLTRGLVIAEGVESGVLHVVAQAASCDAEAEHPACHLTRQDWGVPIVVSATGVRRLVLMLGGMDEDTAG